MSLRFMLILVTFSSSLTLWAQFNVNGVINGIKDEVVFVKLYDGGSLRLINKLQIDDEGKINFNVPETFNGKMRLEFQNRQTLDILTDNNNVTFKADYINNKLINVRFEQGTAALYNTYRKAKELKTVDSDVFSYLKEIYDPQDEFYKAIMSESRRINELYGTIDLQKNSLLNYYDDIENFTENISEKNTSEILNRLVNDSEYIETTGFFTNFILSYLQKSSNTAKNQEEVIPLVDKALNELLIAVDLETFRGQKALTAALQILPKQQFGIIHEKYIEKISSLNCSKTNEVKELISQSKIKVGNKAPDFKLKEKQKGAKSLYDIKTDRKLLMFWASWCPHCQNEIPFVKEYYRNFLEDGGEIVAISLDYIEKDYKNAIKDFEWINHSELLRWDSPTAKLYGINATPTFILLDKDNTIIKIAENFNSMLE